jgi:hypothetical protein
VCRVADTQRLEKQQEEGGTAMRIVALKRIVKDCQAEKIDGVLVDGLTARALLLCWEAGSDTVKELIVTGNIVTVGRSALRICGKPGKP